MKVLVSVVGRFHAFDLAHQLQKANVLYKLNTTYPKQIAKRWGVDPKNIKSNLFLEFLNRFFLKWFPFLKPSVSAYIYRNQSRSNFPLLQNTDVFIGASGASLEAIIAAKARNVITILERGSSHYSYQMNILEEEYGKFNKKMECNYYAWQRELLEYELADYISIPSTYVKRTFIEHGVPESKLMVNPYGVDLSSFRQVPKEDQVFRVIYAGGFTIQKGVKYLLQAFTELNLPNSEFVHLGSINVETEGLIENYKADNIKYLGHQKQGELYKFYSQGSVFVMMSLNDGFGMVVPQAMACGLPIICTKNTGGEDLISKDGEEGFSVDIRDVETLKLRLKYLYDNPEICREMGEKAKKKVASGFTWDDYGDRYVAHLNEITKK